MRSFILFVCLVLNILTLGHSLALAEIHIESQAPIFEDHGSVLDQKPTGLSIPFAKGECQGDEISAIFENRLTIAEQAQDLNFYVKKCGNDITRSRARYTYIPLINFSNIRYRMLENPLVRQITVHFDDGRKVRGLMAMKDSSEARPFIIVKCGVFCDVGESSNFATSIMHLFDESPFHVIVLANITGADFSRENKAVAVGGFDEGAQVFEFARYLKTSFELRDRISSVQVLGISLGGQASLYSSLYSSMNPLPSGEKAIDAVLAMCPVVNLQNSMERLYNSDLISHGATYLTFKTLEKIMEDVPLVGKLINGLSPYKPPRVFSVLKEASIDYYQGWTQLHPQTLSPLKDFRINSEDSLWRANDFLLYYHFVDIPTLLISASNDEIVRSRENTELVPLDNPWVQRVVFPQGDHCAFNMANGYERWSRLLRGYFLSHDPLWHNKLESRRLDISEDLYGGSFWNRFNPPSYAYQLQSEWKIPSEGKYGRLELRIYTYHSSNEESCSGGAEVDYDYMDQPMPCTQVSAHKISIAKLAKLAGVSYPQSNFERWRLERLLNTRAILADDQGVNYLKSQSLPTQVIFK